MTATADQPDDAALRAAAVGDWADVLQWADRVVVPGRGVTFPETLKALIRWAVETRAYETAGALGDHLLAGDPATEWAIDLAAAWSMAGSPESGLRVLVGAGAAGASLDPDRLDGDWRLGAVRALAGYTVFRLRLTLLPTP